MPLFSQENQGPEVIQAAFEVQWREGQAPVGQWNVKEGHWLDEPMGGVRGTVAQCVGNRANFNRIGIVGETESSLTSRQQQLLNQELPAGQWTADAIADAAQWKGPLLRWNASKAFTSGCWTCPVPSGAGGNGFNHSGPHAGLAAALSEGTVLRCPFPIPECTASIEPG